MSSKVLIITGMHRSGTSLTAQYLSECGLHIGSSLHNSDNSNARSAFDGHHEDEEFLELHKEILKAKRVFAFPTNDLRVPVQPNRQHTKKAIELISKRSHLSQWSWKDPRTTLFLNFWDDLILNSKYLFLFRHPLAVVDSLIRRNTNPKIVNKPIIGLRSWIVYNKQIIKFLEKDRERCLILNIDDLIQQPAKNLLEPLQNNFELNLNLIPFEKVFSSRSLQPNYSEAVEQLKQKSSKEVIKSLEIFEYLKEISIDSTY